MTFLASGSEWGIAIGGSNVLFGIVCALLAESRGRSALAWFFIGFLLNCFGFILLLVLPNLDRDSEHDDDAWQRLEAENQQLREQLRAQAEGDPKLDRALWFWLDGQRQVGPVALAELRRQWREGRLGASTYVWCDGMKDWRMLRDLPELEQRFRS